jgi:AraC-like DNA-binding protein
MATIRKRFRPGRSISLQDHDFSSHTLMATESVVAAAVVALLDFVVTKGATKHLLMDRAGVTTEMLRDPDGRVPLARYIALMRAGQDLTRDPALALHFGEAVDISDIAIGCMAAAMNETFTTTFSAMNRYSRLGLDVETSDGGDRFALDRSEGRVWLIDRRANPNAFPELTESTFARMVCSTRRGLGGVSVFREVSFTHPAPAYAEEYARIFQVPVTFSAKRNAIALDEKITRWFRRVPVSSTVARAVQIRADDLLQKLDAQETFRGKVEHLLASALASGGASIEAIAEQLAVSRHTLLRRLKAEGATFDEVLDELRKRMATELLESGASVRQAAHRLGYADPASFSRAFRRWTGVAPGSSARMLRKPRPERSDRD